MLDPIKYKAEIAWRTYFKEVLLVSAETDLVPAIYRVKVVPIDVNQPGASDAEKAVGCYIADYIGSIYRITQINVDGDNSIIYVSDDFREGQCPQSGQQGYLFKSAYKGFSPYLAQILSTHMTRQAIDRIRGRELAVLWRNDPNTISIPFTNTRTPSILNYQDDQLINGELMNLAEDYGEYPDVRLMKYNNSTSDYLNYTPPKYTHSDGLLQSVEWSFALPMSGQILISR